MLSRLHSRWVLRRQALTISGRTATFSADTADRWHWSADLLEGVNFCVWVLLRDGLRVPPFDRHAAGDGQLQAAGLEPDAWRAWLEAVVDLDARLRQTLPWPPRPPQELLQLHSNPTDLWPRESAVGARLRQLWSDYLPHGSAWKQRNVRAGALHLDPPLAQAVWRALEPLHDRLPTLRVYLTEYPWPVSHLVPPVSVILGTDPGIFDQAAYAAAVQQAAEALAHHG